MKQIRQSMECAGSLTPELEGTARSTPHPVRIPRDKGASQTKTGGARYE